MEGRHMMLISLCKIPAEVPVVVVSHPTWVSRLLPLGQR